MKTGDRVYIQDWDTFGHIQGIQRGEVENYIVRSENEILYCDDPIRLNIGEWFNCPRGKVEKVILH